MFLPVWKIGHPTALNITVTSHLETKLYSKLGRGSMVLHYQLMRTQSTDRTLRNQEF